MGHRVAVLKDGNLNQVDTPRTCTTAGQRVRRRVHGLAGDEPADVPLVSDGAQLGDAVFPLLGPSCPRLRPPA